MGAADSERERFEAAYRETPPWEVGQAQPALIALIDEFPPSVPVLDVGCGSGDLSLALARRGLAVRGIDLSNTAIERARSKAADAGVGDLAEFSVGDAFDLSALQQTFNAVVDSGFFHLFGPQERARFANELAAVLPEGGRYYLLGFAFNSPMPNAPRQVTEEELRALFSPEAGWRALAIRPAQFLVRMVPAGVPAIAACFERAAH